MKRIEALERDIEAMLKAKYSFDDKAPAAVSDELYLAYFNAITYGLDMIDFSYGDLPDDWRKMIEELYKYGIRRFTVSADIRNSDMFCLSRHGCKYEDTIEMPKGYFNVYAIVFSL